MKLTATAVLCLSLLLVHLHFSLAGKTGSLLKKILKKPPKTKTNLDSKTKDSILTKAKQPQYNQGGYPRQPAGGYPQNPGRPGGYLNQGGYGGSYGSYGNYPGSYINYNPNNRILSPHYGGSFGYGGHGGGGGSPFSHSVQAMGYVPSDKSRGFGRTAVMAAAGGAMAGMALGYGLGRFPHPNFHFHSPQEEYFYNYYMYRKYGVKSTDSKDYSRDYKYSQSPETFDSYMASCMKRADLLPDSNRKSENRPAVTTSKTSTTTTVKAMTTSAQVTGSGSNTNNNTVAVNLSSTTPSTSHPMNKSEVNPAPPTASPILQKDDDDDTVSIVEIGYPELIRQIKVKRCTELYIVYSEKYLKKKTSTSSGVHGLEMSMRGLLTVLISSMLMLLNSNMLMLLH
ncbi:prion protein b [Melanotaenia boesemani]|uniref:prion protein b n=1 Tax=Melanotaenia boesemani TaxID=1250792 RepID=UPI001C03B5A7|nr:prion protein b [Melanotaenia boesemani]